MIELPRFTLGALRRIHKATGKNLLGQTDPATFADLEFWDSALRAMDPEKADAWQEAFTIGQLLGAFLADTRGKLGGDATADATKSA